MKTQLFREQCARHGLKVTPQRTAIYGELAKAPDHPSADDLYRRVRKILPNISFDTVYRTLLTFTQAGIIRLVEGYGDARRFDPDLEGHHHLHCVRCGKILDFHGPAPEPVKIPRELAGDFTVLGQRLVVEGVCSRCRRK